MQMAAWHSALSQQFRSKSPFSHHTRRHRTHQLWATNKEGVVSRQQRRCKVSSLAEERTNAGWKWNNNLASGTSLLDNLAGSSNHIAMKETSLRATLTNGLTDTCALPTGDSHQH